MGILNRLIGDQRKLYQSRQDRNYFFGAIENLISWEDNKSDYHEVVYLRNMKKDNYDQDSFSGTVNPCHPILTSDYSSQLWEILYLDFNQLCEFIITEQVEINSRKLCPILICERFKEIKKMKKVKDIGNTSEALKILQHFYSDQNYYDKNQMIMPISFYCSALYLQLDKLEKKYDISAALSKKGGLSGIAKKSFTPKDFMKQFAGRKMIYGNPYIKDNYIKGKGKENLTLKKASGELKISLNIDRGKAEEIYKLMEYAGVSTLDFELSMGHYIDLTIKPNNTVSLNILRNNICNEVHKILYEMNSSDIGIDFPQYIKYEDGYQSLGRILRIHSSEESLKKLSVALQLVADLKQNCILSNILSIPSVIKEYRIISRVQQNMSNAKLRRLRKRNSIKTDGIKKYKIKMCMGSLSNAYLELYSYSTGQKYRRYIEIKKEKIEHKGRFDTFGLSYNATVPFF
ncbi:hypothetical protein RFI_02514 [Reticulomyxa filosa]|uniref:Cas5fv helical domain-containing protein n=1 Tax=Reticulomyxa filosa TaxID=46433 RepID=X6P7S4_RETFI|nr:hypothetical protein RFI_02514 [Reticulomyxa filosa]|eukprot:ETO34575.1 hypothetical protein RFI_02514 [Reticulomyxa filosa]